MTRPTVLLTNPIGREGVEILETMANVVTAPDVKPQTLRDCAREADAILVRANLPEDIFEVATRLRGVERPTRFSPLVMLRPLVASPVSR